MFNNSTV